MFLQSVNVHQIKDGRNGVVNNQIQDWSFRLDGIFHNSTQDQVYDTVASNIVTSALDGYNGEFFVAPVRAFLYSNKNIDIFLYFCMKTYVRALLMCIHNIIILTWRNRKKYSPDSPLIHVYRYDYH